ncbi:TonB-dependent receptor [Caulobacter sp. 17J65-9]|uniref:TonB-dependent receptor n=1 Tax=Caulobacter sp. 17J65-9 TaxID=2709382 RepID=UPI001F097C76|nr:TonB-dependent receptor [Caulobacter sp. 17J65-9]
MRSCRIALFGVAVTALSAGVWVAPAVAGDQSDDVEEVVVTATRIGVAEQAMTANVDVLDEKDLAVAPSVGLGDLVAGMPGVRSTSFAPGASRPVIRGLSGPRVQVLTNGLGQIDASSVSPDHQVATDPSSAKRVEVVRGPSTLAYGGSAIGGVVNIIDDRVPSEPAKGLADGRLATQVSSVDNGRSVGGAVKVGEGPWVVGAEAMHRETDDYNIPGPAISQQLANELGVPRVGPSIVLNSRSRLTEYGAGASYITGLGFVGAAVTQTNSRYGTVAEEDVKIDLTQTRYDAQGELDFPVGPFEKFTGSAGYADYQHTELEDGEVGTQFLSTGWEARAEAVQKARGGWNGAVGLQALHRDFDAIGEEAFVPATVIDEAGIYTVQRLDHQAWGFEAGVRLDRRELDSIVADREFTNFSASGGVFFRPATGLYLGLTLARNERAPTEVELFANGPHVATASFEVGDPDFDTEIANSVEAAVHYVSDRFDADLHLFGARYDGFIDAVPTGVFDADTGLQIFQYQQLGAEFYGLETDMTWRVWTDGERTVSLTGAGDYVHGETDLGPPARIPPWSATVGVKYETERWQTALEVHHAGEQDRVAQFELPTDAYTMVNLSGSVNLSDSVVLFGEVHNLNDTEAREAASFLKDIAPLPGRNLRVGLTYRF